MSTHWRTGTRGRTSSTSTAACSAIRRPPQLARRLHEKGTSRSNVQSVQRRRVKPWATTPQVRNSRKLDEAGQAASVAAGRDFPKEGLQVLADDGGEDGVFGVTGLIRAVRMGHALT